MEDERLSNDELNIKFEEMSEKDVVIYNFKKYYKEYIPFIYDLFKDDKELWEKLEEKFSKTNQSNGHYPTIYSLICDFLCNKKFLEKLEKNLSETIKLKGEYSHLYSLIDAFECNAELQRIIKTEIKERLKSEDVSSIEYPSYLNEFNIIREILEKRNFTTIFFLNDINDTAKYTYESIEEKFKPAIETKIKEMLTADDSVSSNAEYCNYLGELIIIRNILEDKNTKLLEIEEKKSSGKHYDLIIQNIISKNIFYIEILNIHLSVHKFNNRDDIYRHLKRKISEKKSIKRFDSLENEIKQKTFFYAVLWHGTEEIIEFAEEFYKVEQTLFFTLASMLNDKFKKEYSRLGEIEQLEREK